MYYKIYFSIIAIASVVSPSAAAQTYSKEDINDVLLAYEAAFSDFKYSYISDAPGGGGGDSVRRITSGLYAQSKGAKRVFFDVKPCELDGEEIKVNDNAGSMGAFDGTKTVSLDRTQDERGYMRAVILPKYDERLFKSMKQLSPHSYVFGYGQSFSELLSSDSVVIASEREVVSGRKTIRISGPVFEGAGEMTLWLCPDLDFLPLRAKFIRKKDNKVMIDYKTSDHVKTDTGLYFPKKITIHGWDPNYEATMTMKNMSTEPLPVEFFRPQLPPNTHVTDHLLKVSYTTSDAANLGVAQLNSKTPIETPNDINALRMVTDAFPSDEKPLLNENISEKSLERYVSEAERIRNAAKEVKKTASKGGNYNKPVLWAGICVVGAFVTLLIFFLKKKRAT